MRKVQFAVGQFYHIYNRGVNKQNIFLDRRDYVRFLFILLSFQSELPVYNISRYVSTFIKHSVFNITEKIFDKITEKKIVELVSFVLMPNHFHLILHEIEDGGISRYMQKVLNAYAKYFNTKYKRSGHLFQGPFQAVFIETNEQLLHLSAYVHRNPRELKGWKNKEHKYPWSSFQDFCNENRWGELLVPNIIMEQFKSPEEYKDFMDTSGAKDNNKNTDKYLYID